MIVFETARDPHARAGEEEVGGRRISGRLLPYGGEGDATSARFDPVARRFALPRAEATVWAGPSRPEVWRGAASRLPPGPVLVGPGSAAEAIRGAYRAAAEGALAAGRGVFLLDPPPEGIPDSGTGAVALCSFSPRPGAAFPALAAARERGIASGVLFPLVPGWTSETGALDALLSEAAAGGATTATPLLPEADGEARRSIVEARSAASPAAADDFFDSIHHQAWISRMAERLPEVRRLCAARGLSVLPPRPAGLREPPGNAAASAALEELAELGGLPEHRTASLRAAVRWIDESARDLSAVTREGNFRKVFPFDGDIAGAAEAALAASR